MISKLNPKYNIGLRPNLSTYLIAKNVVSIFNNPIIIVEVDGLVKPASLNMSVE